MATTHLQVQVSLGNVCWRQGQHTAEAIGPRVFQGSRADIMLAMQTLTRVSLGVS